MDLYRKVEHDNGDVTYERVETQPSARAVQVAADYKYIMEQMGDQGLDIDLLALVERLYRQG